MSAYRRMERVSSMTSGGIAIAAATIVLRRSDGSGSI
jgi:hypothetical protein